MDAFWDTALLVPNKRTKEFTHVLAEVVKFVENLEGAAKESMDNIRKGTERVKKTVIGKLDDGLEVYIQSFRLENPDSEQSSDSEG